MTDINTTIAAFKGIDITRTHCMPNYGAEMDGTRCVHCFQHIDSDEENELCIPDFEHDARLYMALFEEMSSEFFSLTLMQHDYNNKTTVIGDYRHGHNENIPQFVVESEPIGTAICLAYKKLHGLE